MPLRIFGAFAILAWLIGMWSKRDWLDSLFLYVVGGACIVFAYPWFDTRLWLPFVPSLLGYILLGLRRMFSPRLLRPLLVAYCSCFCLLGILALGFSTPADVRGTSIPGHLR